MKVQLPRELRGIKFSKVLGIELNSFNIERLLPGLFFLIVADGHGTIRKERDDETVGKHIDLLIKKDDLKGFEGSEGKLLLERLVRATLITTIHNSGERLKERVASIKPYSLVSMKTAETQGLRRVDVFMYQALKSVPTDKKTDKKDNLKEYLIRIFGTGVTITERPDLDGKYDGHTDLDTLTRLSILFLDGFGSAASNVKRDKEDLLGACPALATEIGQDTLRYLFAYHNLMPTQAFMHYLQGLLGFELYLYTVKVAAAINELVADPEHLPDAMQPVFRPAHPHMYLDFTGKSDSQSATMAKASIGRDIETYQQFFTSNLLLRQLDAYISQLRDPSSRLKAQTEQEIAGTETGPGYLQKILLLQKHPKLGMRIDGLAGGNVDDIRKFNSPPKDAPGVATLEDDLAWLDAIASSGETELESVVALLSETQRAEAITKYLKWLWEVGGSGSDFSLIEGRRRYRPSWRYAPTNELLSLLVQLAATSIGPTEGQPVNERGIYTIRLQDFLDFLSTRFGILIDRPPSQFEGAEYVAAAHENLRAMLRRLRQMGIFRDLSDDFTALRLHPPYAGEYLEQVEVGK